MTGVRCHKNESCKNLYFLHSTFPSALTLHAMINYFEYSCSNITVPLNALVILSKDFHVKSLCDLSLTLCLNLPKHTYIGSEDTHNALQSNSLKKNFFYTRTWMNHNTQATQQKSIRHYKIDEKTFLCSTYWNIAANYCIALTRFVLNLDALYFLKIFMNLWSAYFFVWWIGLSNTLFNR